MAEWILSKMVYFSDKNKRNIFRVLNLIRNFLLRFYDPIVKIKIGKEKLYINFSHQLPLYLVKHRLYDTALPRIVKEIGVGRKLNVIDVGANVGDTVALIKSSSDNVSFLCIEGNLTYSTLLKKNFKDDKSIFIEEVFCSDVSEEVSISINTGGGTATIDLNVKEKSKYNFLTLDEILNKHNEFVNVDLIKVDTDGFDYKVIRGAYNILKNQQPLVFFELDKLLLLKNNEDPMSIFSFFYELRYEGFLLYDNYGYLLGLFDFTQLKSVCYIVDYMADKYMYLDVLMIKDIEQANILYHFESESIKRNLDAV